MRGSAGAGSIPRVPPVLAGATAWSWRLLLVAGAVTALLALLRYFSLVTLPICGAILLAALLNPVRSRLRRRGWSRGLSTSLALLAAAVVLGGIGWIATTQTIAGYPALVRQATSTVDTLGGQVAALPGASLFNVPAIETQALTWLQAHASAVAGGTLTGILTAGASAARAAAGLIVMVFATFFFVHQGDKIFAWTVRLFPTSVHRSIAGAGYRAWYTLAGWIGGTAIVAAINGTVIGAVLAILGVPLAVALGLVIAVGSFLPVAGIFIGGAIAVLVAFFAQGPVIALVVLVVIVVEHQLEAHLLQPLVVGRAVRLHPLAIVIALTAGAVLAGFWGALLAVPLAATANAAMLYLTGVEDVRGNRRVPGSRMAPMQVPTYAPLPFLGINPAGAEEVPGGGEHAGEALKGPDGDAHVTPEAAPAAPECHEESLAPP